MVAAQLSLSELAGRGLERAGWGGGESQKWLPYTPVSLSLEGPFVRGKGGGGAPQKPFKEGMREEGEEEFLFLPPPPHPSDLLLRTTQ